jgi:hypothetical protein
MWSKQMPENQSTKAKRKRGLNGWPALVLLLVLSPLLLPLLVVLVVSWLAGALALHLLTLIVWLPAGRRVLFVYSNSPIWKDHIEAEVLPRLPSTAAVLNWSQRSEWSRWSLSVWLFRFYAGNREYNPLAIVIRPWRGPMLFRFWRAFRDSKHGTIEPLRALEASFFQSIAAS